MKGRYAASSFRKSENHHSVFVNLFSFPIYKNILLKYFTQEYVKWETHFLFIKHYTF